MGVGDGEVLSGVQGRDPDGGSGATRAKPQKLNTVTFLTVNLPAISHMNVLNIRKTQSLCYTHILQTPVGDALLLCILPLMYPFLMSTKTNS